MNLLTISHTFQILFICTRGGQ